MAAGGIRCYMISFSKSNSSCCSDIGLCSYLRTRERTRVRVSYLMDSYTNSFNFKFIPGSYSLCRFLSPAPKHLVNVRCMHAKSNPQLHPFSQREDDRVFSSEGLVSVAGGVVALGKFDALHIGHRELAIQASKAGIPFLLSFVGMAEVFGWEPRAPIVAKCDRMRVLSSWASYCGNVSPTELHVEFSSVRHLSPRQFVEKLAKELGVRGVVAGENYRFGYKAAGDAAELVTLCKEYGMEAYIVGTVLDKKQLVGIRSSIDPKDKGQVSSTRVRQALAVGDVRYVLELLGRRHRLVMVFDEEKGFVCKDNMIRAPKSCLLNLPPKEGLYINCNCIIGDTVVAGCSTIIDATHVHIESTQHLPLPEYGLIGIEFGGAEEVSC